MRAYFVQIAAVRLAASLLGKELVDNYGFHGALPRFKGVKVDAISEVEGIDHVPAKAESFRFGLSCGDVIAKCLEGYSEKETLSFEAAVAKNLFLDLSPEKRARYTDAELRNSMNLIFRALLKKAQIRTHTAKPGGEDINKWLEGYYRLEQDFNPYVSSLVEAILAFNPDPAVAKKEIEFFDRTDPIIARALQGMPLKTKEEKDALKKSRSLFGKILEASIEQAD